MQRSNASRSEASAIIDCARTGVCASRQMLQIARRISFRGPRLASMAFAELPSCSASMSSAAASAAGSGGGVKLWGGRFTGKTDPLMERFNNSIAFDKRLWRADIDGSIAYAKALGRCGLLKAGEVTSIVDGLALVRFRSLLALRGSSPRLRGGCLALAVVQRRPSQPGSAYTCSAANTSQSGACTSPRSWRIPSRCLAAIRLCRQPLSRRSPALLCRFSPAVVTA